LIPFYFFFFSVWYPSVVKFGRGLIPDSNRPRALELLGKMDNVVAGFVRGRIVISLIMGVMLAAGWAFCGVPYAIVLGLIVGLFCAVPYLGGVGIPLAVVFLAFQELGEPNEAERMAWWGIILWPTLVFGFVQVFEGYVLTPMIAGKATNLDPVTILVVVLAGGSIMGIYGMLLAIPVAACLKILCTDVLLPKVRAWTSGEAQDPLPFDRD
ncbi:MAG: AI-2E family transporter, partial [Planctomycetota bacterium]